MRHHSLGFLQFFVHGFLYLEHICNSWYKEQSLGFLKDSFYSFPFFSTYGAEIYFFICLVIFFLKTGHFEHYNIGTLETQTSSPPQGLLLFLIVVVYFLNYFSELILQSLHSLSCVTSEVSVSLA